MEYSLTDLKPSIGEGERVISSVKTPDRAEATSTTYLSGKWQIKRTTIDSSSNRVVTIGKEE